MKRVFDINNNFIANNIHNKILAPMLLLSLIPIIIFGVIFLNNTYDELEDKKFLELQTSLKLKNDKLELIFSSIERELKLIISNVGLKNLDSSFTEVVVNDNLQSTIDFFIESEPAVNAVRVIDQYGDVYLEFQPNVDHDSNVEYTAFLEKYLKSDLSKIYYSKVFSDIHDHKSMFIAYPTNEFDVNSILVLTVDLDYVYSLIIDQSGLGASGEILLGQKVENKAELIYYPKQDFHEIYFNSIFLTEERALPIRESVQGISGCGSVTDYSFEPVIACWGPTAFLDWGIVAKIDQKEVFESVNSNVILFLIIISSTLLLIIFFSSLVAKGIQNPILELNHIFKEFNGGKYDSIVKIQGHDEIADLTKSFQTFQEYFSANDKIKKFYQKELEEKLSELKKTDVLKDEFASMVTHELKTPLTPIRGYCEMLKENSLGKLTPEQLDCIETIDSNAFHLEKLIGDILDAQKLDMGRMVFNKTKIQLSLFISELTKTIQLMFAKKNIQLVVSPIDDCLIFTDEQRLKQIFHNLIRNAIDFVPENFGKIEIGFTLHDDDVIFYVKDDGIGIPENKQSRIFKKFYQVNTAQTRQHGGTGIGLVICKGIVEGLEGKIWFESVVNQGTTFYFSIPKSSSISVEAK